MTLEKEGGGRPTRNRPDRRTERCTAAFRHDVGDDPFRVILISQVTPTFCFQSAFLPLNRWRSDSVFSPTVVISPFAPTVPARDGAALLGEAEGNRRLLRLGRTGAIEPAFQSVLEMGANGGVTKIELLDDGKIWCLEDLLEREGSWWDL